MRSFLTLILLITFATAAPAQNVIKLFDPVPINVSDPNILLNSDPHGMFKSAQVYLSCPSSGRVSSTISGPNGADLIVDNVLTVNGEYVCSGSCFSASMRPENYVGMPVETAYVGVRPLNVSRVIAESGLYTFNLIDYGQVYGSGAVYLTTSCSIIPINTPTDPTTPPPSGTVVCHRDNGSGDPTTLNVGASAVAAHLAHGDTPGPCSQ